MEHQRELPSAEHPLRQPHRDPPSFSGPFVAPSTSSTPVKRKPKAWYMTDSFTEQFSPPGSRFSFAQPSFEIGYPLPAVPPQQQQREALGQSLMPKPPEKGYPPALASLQQQRESIYQSLVPNPPEKRQLLSDLPPPPPQQQRDTLQAATPAMDDPKDGDGENTDPGLGVISGVADDEQLSPTYPP